MFVDGGVLETHVLMVHHTSTGDSQSDSWLVAEDSWLDSQLDRLLDNW
jgi:hypothetical protein